MKLNVDDWHFRESEQGALVLDVFLDNGQHALMEVNPMWNPETVNGEIPEMIVFGELPGERFTDGGGNCRWVYRPPMRTCPWSNVQIPMALMEQIKARLQTSTAARP